MTQARGRPIKQGLDYFALDVSMNDEVELIEAAHGIAGFAILVKMYQKIYSEGYYLDWDKRQQLLTSIRIGVDVNVLNAVINDCVEWGIFNKDLFDDFQILTSRRIQDQFVRATTRRARVEIVKDYWLIELPCRDNVIVLSIDGAVIADINSINTGNKPPSRPLSDDINAVATELMSCNNSQSKSKSKSKSKSQSKSESNISTLLLNSDLSPSGESAPESMPESKEVKRNLNQERFDEFWSLYPRKVGKQAALKAWRKIRPDADLHAKIVAAVNSQKTTEQWTIENGRFVPNPTTWLNQGRWDDELPKGNGQSGGRRGPYVSERDRIKEAHEYDHPTDIKYSPVFQAFYEKELAKKAQEEQNHD